jgi:hypothetical protein
LKYKTSELLPPLLDLAVAQVLGLPVHPGRGDYIEVTTLEMPAYADEINPSIYWSVAGEIIERERISIIREHWDDEWLAGMNAEVGVHERLDHAMRGPTPLIAAMRTFVSAKLGDEVDL